MKKQNDILNHKSVDDPLTLFTMVEILGEGAYGKVYKAISKKDGKSYAVKVVHVENDITDLEQEIKILKKCNSPYIVNYYDSFLHPSQNDLWIVIELCEGEKKLNEKQVAVVARETLKGLHYLHTQKPKKIHRDIKSGNILITSDGNIKLTDFGVSAQLTNSMSRRNSVIGSPYWMAPEVIMGKDYFENIDVWSLAITMIELLEGKPPLHHIHPLRAIFMIPNRPPPTLSDPKKWSPELNNFLKLCLTKDPLKRPNCKELLRHPFITNAQPTEILQVLIDQLNQKFSEYPDGRKGYLEAMKGPISEDSGESVDDFDSLVTDSEYETDSDSDSDSDSDDDKYSTIKFLGTLKNNESTDSDSSEDESESEDFGSMIRRSSVRVKGAWEDSSRRKKSTIKKKRIKKGSKTIKKVKKSRTKRRKIGTIVKKNEIGKKLSFRKEKASARKKVFDQVKKEEVEVLRLVRLYENFDLGELRVQFKRINQEKSRKIESIDNEYTNREILVKKVLSQKA